MSTDVVDPERESDRPPGDSEHDYVEGGDGGVMMEDTERASAIESSAGYSRFRDPVTIKLGALTGVRDSVHKSYISTLLRANAMKERAPACSEMLNQWAKDGLRKIKEEIDRELVKTLRSHVLYDWLDTHRVRGAHVARFISMIRNPHLYPGRECSAGHHLPCDWVGECPVECGEKGEKPTVCKAVVGPTRRGTGVRSLWHYFGLHVVNGHAPEMRKGFQCTWRPMGKACLLQPEGIADQIVRHRQEPWRSKYDETKKRLLLERGVDNGNEIEVASGAALEQGNADGSSEIENRSGIAASGGAVEVLPEIDRSRGTLRPIEIERGIEPTDEIEQKAGAALEQGNADRRSEIEERPGIATSGGAVDSRGEIDPPLGSLRPIAIERIAKKVAVKAFAGDLLMAWKARDPFPVKD